jgi:hypothetical protein
MARKLSITNLALVLFITMLCLCIYTQFNMQSKYQPSYAINAEKLDQKPTSYFPLANPDNHVRDAINSGGYVDFRSLDETPIDELTQHHGTNNIEYNGTFYQVGIVAKERFPPSALSPILLAGIVISISALVSIGLFKASKFHRK